MLSNKIVSDKCETPEDNDGKQIKRIEQDALEDIGAKLRVKNLLTHFLKCK